MALLRKNYHKCVQHVLVQHSCYEHVMSGKRSIFVIQINQPQSDYEMLQKVLSNKSNARLRKRQQQKQEINTKKIPLDSKTIPSLLLVKKDVVQTISGMHFVYYHNSSMTEVFILKKEEYTNYTKRYELKKKKNRKVHNSRKPLSKLLNCRVQFPS